MNISDLTMTIEDNGGTKSTSRDETSLSSGSLDRAVKSASEYQPSPSVSILAQDHNIRPDYDIWVERWYKSQAGLRIYYYVSMKDNSSQLLEPPTGASIIIPQGELEQQPQQVKEMSRKKISNAELQKIPYPEPDCHFFRQCRRRAFRKTRRPDSVKGLWWRKPNNS